MNLDAGFGRQKKPQPDEDSSSVSGSTIKERAAQLPQVLKSNLESLSQKGEVEEFFRSLSDYGITESEQQQYASHFMREYAEGSRVISWTKPRLMYAAALLKHTLEGENPNPSSAENMIRNYLIFSKIFKEGEGSIPRFGQFNYVVRGIFAGIKTKEDIPKIFERIEDHKTFGEASVTREEAERFDRENSEAIDKVYNEYTEKMIRSAERLKSLNKKENLANAIQEEDKAKGLVWSTTYSKPREYEFPHYTFQTGKMAGKNTAVGRSTWEPMYMAFVDIANKTMEDMVARQFPSLSDDEKKVEIQKRRIELLYEPFSLPVGIKKLDNGGERLIMYIPDFVDINRWRVTEIKGPLTPSAREKIEAFQKYYIEGDFSGLPEEQQIVMMRCVGDKVAEVKRWCEENNYPVHDKFQDYRVFGAHRWDFDLMNFNRYDLKETKGLSEKSNKKLRTGLVKFIENKIRDGTYPDIRPQGYIDTARLKGLMAENLAEARRLEKKGLLDTPYVLEEAFRTQPFLPEVFVNQIFPADPNAKLASDSLRGISSYVLDTMPVHTQIKQKVLDVEGFVEILRSINTRITTDMRGEHYDLVYSGKKLIRLPFGKAGIDLTSTFKKMSDIIVQLAREKISEDPENVYDKEFRYQANRAEKYIASLSKHVDKKGNNLILGKDYFLTTAPQLNSEEKHNSLNIEEYFSRRILKKHYRLFDDRRSVVLDLISGRYAEKEDSEKIEERIQKQVTAISIPPENFSYVADLFARRLLRPFGFSAELRAIASFLIYLKTIPLIPGSDQINDLTDILREKFTTSGEAKSYLTDMADVSAPMSTPLQKTLDTLFENKNRREVSGEELMRVRRELFENKEALITILELLMKDRLKERFVEFDSAMERELNSEQMTEIKKKLVSIQI